MQVAKIYNEHGLGIGIERIDPPLNSKKFKIDNNDNKAAYAFNTANNRKVVICRLLELTRKTHNKNVIDKKKVMVRVGGGWKELSSYLFERQQQASH